MKQHWGNHYTFSSSVKLAALTLGAVVVSGLRLSCHQGTPFCPWEHAWPEKHTLQWSESELCRYKLNPGSWEMFPCAAEVHKDSDVYLLTQRCFPEAEFVTLFYRYQRMPSLILPHITGTRMIISWQMKALNQSSSTWERDFWGYCYIIWNNILEFKFTLLYFSLEVTVYKYFPLFYHCW